MQKSVRKCRQIHPKPLKIEVWTGLCFQSLLKPLFLFRLEVSWGVLARLGGVLEASWTAKPAQHKPVSVREREARMFGYSSSKSLAIRSRNLQKICRNLPKSFRKRPQNHPKPLKIEVRTGLCFQSLLRPLFLFRLEVSWGVLGGSWGDLWSVLGASWARLATS